MTQALSASVVVQEDIVVLPAGRVDAPLPVGGLLTNVPLSKEPFEIRFCEHDPTKLDVVVGIGVVVVGAFVVVAAVVVVVVEAVVVARVVDVVVVADAVEESQQQQVTLIKVRPEIELSEPQLTVGQT